MFFSGWWQPIERTPRVFAPLVIPKDLQRALPFKDKPKVPKSSKDPVQSNRIAVVREPKERQVGQLLVPSLYGFWLWLFLNILHDTQCCGAFLCLNRYQSVCIMGEFSLSLSIRWD